MNLGVLTNFNPFQPTFKPVLHSIWKPAIDLHQMTGFYMKCNTGVELVNYTFTITYLD